MRKLRPIAVSIISVALSLCFFPESSRAQIDWRKCFRPLRAGAIVPNGFQPEIPAHVDLTGKHAFEKRSFPPEQVKLVPYAGNEKADIDNAAYLKGMQRLAQEIRSKFGQASEITGTVVYPLSGADAGLTVTLFPKAQTIVGITEQAFSDSPIFLGNEFQYSLATGLAFQNVDSLRSEGIVGPKIIGSLEKALPHFRLKKVTIYRDPALQGVNGIVEFDQGPGTPTQRYIHIQANMERSKRIPWMQDVIALHPQAVIVKASQGFLQRPISPLRDDLLKALQENHGFLIEGQKRPHWDVEYVPEVVTKDVKLPETTDRKDLGPYPYGYGTRVFVTHFR